MEGASAEKASMAHVSLNGVASESVLLSIQEVEARIQQLLAENSGLRNTLQQNNTYMRQLSVTLIEWQEEIVRVQKTYQAKFEKAKDLVEKLRRENADLKKRIELASWQTSEPVDNILSRNGPNPNQDEQLDSYVLIPSSATEHLKRSKQEAAGKENSLSSCDSLDHHQVTSTSSSSDKCEIHQLQKEANSLRNQLAAEMESNKSKQQLLNQTQSQLDRLMVEFQALSKQWGNRNVEGFSLSAAHDKAEIEDLKRKNVLLDQQCTELQQRLLSSNTRLAVAEEIALNKQLRNTELEAEVNRLQKSVETMDLLKVQIDQYQTDFQAEREARQNLAGEKDALDQQLRQLKRQLERNAVEDVAVAGQPERPSASYSYECPKCSFKYSSIDTLNNHLDICLTQHMFP